jgi:hypothetical protein
MQGRIDMVNKSIDNQLEEIDGNSPTEETAVDEYTAVYQVFPNSKIPVSKQTGAFWQRRKDEGQNALKNGGVTDRWDEAISYYQNDQGGKSGKRRGLSGVATGADGETAYSTENVVFANVSALVPAVYAKNPDIEITSTKPADDKKAELFESLLDTLIIRKAQPGINLKPKMRRGIVMAMLTNLAYFEVSYVKKGDSSDAVVAEVEKLSLALQEAKTTKELADIEGKLLALDEKINLLGPSGPKVRMRRPHDVIVDPNREEADLTDASYIIVGDYIRTETLRATYGKKNEKGEWLPIYDPTHIIKAGEVDINGHDDAINNFTLLGGDDADYQKYGYKNEAAYKNACRTRIWYVWDKATRRVLMFNDKDWGSPIWVWDDPYKLTRFYPFFALTFYADPVDPVGRSEVMYYLDQQDELNVMNNEKARMRHWVLSKVFVNTTVLKDATAIAKFLDGSSTDKVYGVALPENAKISDAIGTMPAPSTQFKELFDGQEILQSINRISSVGPILQNEQFKTNTTNKAIENYESSTQTRLDEKIDAIEDLIGDIGVALMEMCVQFMSETEVVDLLGPEIVSAAGGWDFGLTPSEMNRLYNFKVVGGSTLKPTSKVKKDQAIQLGQVLGQFVQASPLVVVMMLRIFERAFNEDFVVTKEEWAQLNQAITQSVTAGPQTQSGQPTSESGQSQQGSGQEQAMIAGVETLAKIIDTLDPAIKQQVGAAIAEGIPLKEIVSGLTQPGPEQQAQPQQ